MGCVLGVRQTRSTLDEMNTEQLGLCQNEVITMGWAAISKGAYGMRWKTKYQGCCGNGVPRVVPKMRVENRLWRGQHGAQKKE